jgi:hypothetical protein
LKSTESKEHIDNKEQSPSDIEPSSTVECSFPEESLSTQTLSTRHEEEGGEKPRLTEQVWRNKYCISPKVIKSSILHDLGFQSPLKSNVKAKNAGGIMDVTTVIFGLLFLISLAFAILFFISALFAKDSLVLTVLLMIGGGFFLVSLVFMLIWLLLRRKTAGNG